MEVINQKSNQGFGVAGLTLGILALIVDLIPCFGWWALILAILAIVFGSVHLGNSNNNDRGIGIAAIILGILAIGFKLLLISVFVGLLTSLSP